MNEKYIYLISSCCRLSVNNCIHDDTFIISIEIILTVEYIYYDFWALTKLRLIFVYVSFFFVLPAICSLSSENLNSL